RDYISLVASLSFVRVRETWRVSMDAGRSNAYKAAPDAMRAVQQVEAYIQRCGLEKRLIELVKMRASQINGCAYCLHVHSKDARRGGETEKRLYLLDAWHESSLSTERGDLRHSVIPSLPMI